MTSGLGGMSGAQGKAVEIAGGVGIIAEVDMSRINTRHSQGWVGNCQTPEDAFALARISMDLEKIHRFPWQHRGSLNMPPPMTSDRPLSDQTSYESPIPAATAPPG